MRALTGERRNRGPVSTQRQAVTDRSKLQRSTHSKAKYSDTDEGHVHDEDQPGHRDDNPSSSDLELQSRSDLIRTTTSSDLEEVRIPLLAHKKRPMHVSPESSPMAKDHPTHSRGGGDDDDGEKEDAEDETSETTGKASATAVAANKRKPREIVHISKATSHVRRLFFASVFAGLFVMVGLTYLGALLLESWGTIHTGVTHAFWSIAVVMTIVGIIMMVTEKRKWMCNAQAHHQAVYALVLCVYFTLLLSAFHYYVDNPYINTIVTRLMMLLGLMVLFALVGYGRFSHGCGSLFIIAVMAVVVVIWVIRPHQSYFDQFRHPSEFQDHAETLIPPNEVQHTIVVVLGTFCLMLYILWHMDEVSADVFTHDPMFLVTRIYVLIMTALLFWCFPSIKSSVQIAWKK